MGPFSEKFYKILNQPKSAKCQKTAARCRVIELLNYYKDNFLKKCELIQLPRFIILYIKRFTKNTFFVEKNPTIVNFPVKSIEFGDLLSEEVKAKHTEGTTYDLMANIVHDGKPEGGSYKVHVLHKGSGKWYEMADLYCQEILPQMITLTEAYIQV